ncbi:MAG: hypothetical protein ABSD96_18110 [Candidatus Korobacteraceae bacterium]|jgi:hypothetical protein
MPRLLDLILGSSAPPAVMHNAACGKLNVPPMERLEILVHLASHSELGGQARASLQSWDEQELAALCGGEDIPASVAEFFFRSGTDRTPVIASLLRNLAIAEATVTQFAERAHSDVIPLIIFAALERRNRSLLVSVGGNHESLRFRHEIEEALREIEKTSDEEAEVLARYQQEHAEEIAAQQHTPFELTVVSSDEKDELAELLPLVQKTPAAAAVDQKLIKEEQRAQLSTLQKIASLTVTERVALAMRGSREERMILIRDGVRVVAVAVLESPKVSEQEMESFANMKNVQEVVLRGIAQRRRFMKVYGVVKALVANPRTPSEIALPLIKTLLLVDLKNLVKNRSVPDMVRRLATKSFLEKSKTHNR